MNKGLGSQSDAQRRADRIRIFREELSELERQKVFELNPDQLQVQDGRGNGDRVIDLSRQRCFEAAPLFDGVWQITGMP